MPIYRVTIKGDDKPRLVKADSAAKARDHVVDAETVNADELADLIEGGATIERVGTPETPTPSPTPTPAPAGDNQGGE